MSESEATTVTREETGEDPAIRFRTLLLRFRQACVAYGHMRGSGDYTPLELHDAFIEADRIQWELIKEALGG